MERLLQMQHTLKIEPPSPQSQSFESIILQYELDQPKAPSVATERFASSVLDRNNGFEGPPTLIPGVLPDDQVLVSIVLKPGKGKPELQSDWQVVDWEANESQGISRAMEFALNDTENNEMFNAKVTLAVRFLCSNSSSVLTDESDLGTSSSWKTSLLTPLKSPMDDSAKPGIEDGLMASHSDFQQKGFWASLLSRSSMNSTGVASQELNNMAGGGCAANLERSKSNGHRRQRSSFLCCFGSSHAVVDSCSEQVYKKQASAPLPSTAASAACELPNHTIEPVTEAEVKRALALLYQAKHLTKDQVADFEDTLERMRPKTTMGYRPKGDYGPRKLLADKGLQRSMLESILVEIQPFHYGQQLKGEDWYRKEICLECHSDTSVQSCCSSGADAAPPPQCSPSPCSSSQGQNDNEITPYLALAQGTKSLGCSTASRQSSDFQVLLSCRAMYATTDQMSEGAEAACFCIALDVAEHLVCGKKVTPGCLTSLIKSGGASWRAMCKDSSLHVPADGHVDFQAAMKFRKLGQTPGSTPLYEHEEAYCQIGPAGKDQSGTTLSQLVAHATSVAAASSEDSQMAVYVLTCNRHTTVVAFHADGKVWQINSLGHSLEECCRVGHLLEFQSTADFCRVYEHGNRPSSIEAVQVESHRINLSLPANGEVAFMAFTEPL
eukprot:gene25790-11460_t